MESPFRGLGVRSTSGASYGRRIKNSVVRRAPRLECYLCTDFTYPTKAPRKFAEAFGRTYSDMWIQVSCECEARARNPPRGVTVWETTGSHEACKGTPTRQPGDLLTMCTDQGNRAGSPSGSHYAAPHLPRRPQLCTMFVHDAAPILTPMTCRHPSS